MNNPQTQTKAVFRAAGYALGVLLALAAAWVALSKIDLQSLPPIRPHMLALMAVGVVASLTLTAALFWAITRTFDASPPVTLARMAVLIIASGLLNYLPLRPGMIGRGAYLKARHALPLTQYALSLFIVLVVSLVVALATVASLTAFPEHGGYMLIVLFVLVAMLTPPIVKATLRPNAWHAWSWVPLKALDLMATTARLWLAFAVIGSPITWREAALVASAAMLAGLAAITPNALGLREWAVALVTVWMLPVSGPVGALATLADRAVEAVVFTLLGLPCVIALRPGASQPDAASEHAAERADQRQ